MDDSDADAKIQLLKNILKSGNEIYIKAIMSNLIAFNDAIMASMRAEQKIPPGMVLVKNRRSGKDRRIQDDPDFDPNKNQRHGGDRRNAAEG